MLYEKIVKTLKNADIPFTTYRHKPVRTSEEAAKVRGTDMSEGAKAMIFIADKSPIMVVVPGDKKVDTKAIKKNLKIKDLKFAKKEEAEKISGVEIGGIPPFGNLFDPPIKVYASQGILQKEEIVFNAGSRSVSIKMKRDDWQKVVNPEIGNYN